MASTTFVDNQSVIYAAWLNDVNNAVYNGIFANGVLNPTSINSTNLVTTNATIGTLTIGNFSLSVSGSKLYIKYSGTNVASIDSSGNIISAQNVTAYGTP